MFRWAIGEYYKRHGCRVLPMPPDLKYSLDLSLADGADRTVIKAMYVPAFRLG